MIYKGKTITGAVFDTIIDGVFDGIRLVHRSMYQPIPSFVSNGVNPVFLDRCCLTRVYMGFDGIEISDLAGF